MSLEAATRRLERAIANLDPKTIRFLAHELGSSDHPSVRAYTWNDCPMTLAQRVGNTLTQKYKEESAVSGFATAWDDFMRVAEIVAKTEHGENTPLTNGYGVMVVNELARKVLLEQAKSKFHKAKNKVRDAFTTECVTDSIAQDQMTTIASMIMPYSQNKPVVPDNLIKFE